MKHNYINFKAKLGCLLLGLAFSCSLQAQTSYVFTSCGQTGTTAPTQAQANTAYNLTNLSGSVTVTNGIQSFTVPQTGPYRIVAIGAQGGYSGGPGAYMAGDFTLTAGTVLKILVGQTGSSANNGTGGPNASGGGGGGSFVSSPSPAFVPYVVAGGGGGDATGYASDISFTCTGYVPGMEASLTTTGNAEPTNGTLGGNSGNGGLNCGNASSGNGAGFYGDASACLSAAAAASFTNGGAAGLNGPNANTAGDGGFGGGGGCYDSGVGERGGGGGGYSGGAGGAAIESQAVCDAPGGGGGSFNSGANQTNSVTAMGLGDGKVMVILLCNINISSSASPSLAPLICSGTSVTLTTNGTSPYNWSNGATTASIVISPTTTTTYTLGASGASGCSGQAAITVSVNHTPTITAVRSASAVCAGKSETLTASGANTYTWNNSVTNGVSFVPASTATYIVKGTNACGTASTAISVTVNPLPTIGGSVNNPTVCNGSTVIFNGSGSASGYTWTNGVTNNATFTPGSTNDYTVTGASALGCTNTAVVGVTVFVTPTTPPSASPGAICLNKSTTLTAVGATGYTWNVSPPAYTSSINVTPSVTTTYTLYRMNGACSSTAMITVTVNPLPPLQITGPTPSVACIGSSITISAAGAITYTWSPGFYTTSGITVYPNSSREYTVVGSNANCTVALTASVTINPGPTINIQPSATEVCMGTAVTLTASGASTYTWASPVSSNSVITNTPSSTTIYTVSGTNSFGCIGVQNTFIQVDPVPNQTLSVVNPGAYICAGNIGTLVATTSSALPVPSYSWSTGATTSQIYVNPASQTVYTVTGTYTNTGCKTVKTVTLAVYISTFVVTAPPAFCKGQSATLTAVGPATSYSWSNGLGTSSTVVISPTNNTPYYVTGITGNCSTTQTVNITVNPLPVLTLSLGKTTICRLEAGSIMASGSSTAYVWDDGATTSSISITPTVTTSYTVTGTDANGCIKTVTITQYVSACLGLEAFTGNLGDMLNIYPNPSNGEFTIHAQAAMNISVVNETGQVVKQSSLVESNRQLTISTLAEGIYFIIAEKDGSRATKKVVVSN